LTWNYRVMERTFPKEEEKVYEIHEVYYEGEKIVGISKEPIYLFGNSIEELKSDLEMQKAAFEKEILNYDTFVKNFDKREKKVVEKKEIENKLKDIQIGNFKKKTKRR